MKKKKLEFLRGETEEEIVSERHLYWMIFIPPLVLGDGICSQTIAFVKMICFEKMGRENWYFHTKST